GFARAPRVFRSETMRVRVTMPTMRPPSQTGRSLTFSTSIFFATSLIGSSGVAHSTFRLIRSLRVNILWNLRARRSLPVRGVAVVRVDLFPPGPVAHVGPLVLVEPGRSFQRLLVDMEDERVLRGTIGKGGKGDGEELVADAEESAEGQNGIGDAPLQ